MSRVAGPPPYVQLDTLLSFLKDALRSDPILIQYFGPPNEIVSGAALHVPARQNGDMVVWDTELPVLCIYESGPVNVVREGSHWGFKSVLTLAYVYRPHIGSADCSPEEWSQKKNALIWDRICYWLHRGRFDAPDYTFDLLTDGKIQSITPLRCRAIGDEQSYEGIQAEIEMVRLYPPYEEPAPTPFSSVDLELHPGDLSPSNTGPIVEKDIDVST